MKLRFLRSAFSRAGIMGEFLRFLWREKLYWMIAVAVVLLIFAILILLSSAVPLPPWIYPLL